MADIPAENYSQPWAMDSRVPLPLVGDEREVLTAYLDWHRKTFELKCSGVRPEQLSEKSIPPSGMSLHGLLRHLAGVERWWFRLQFAGEELPMLYYSDDDPGQDFGRLDGDVGQALAVWQAVCQRGPARSSPQQRPLMRPGSSGRVALTWIERTELSPTPSGVNCSTFCARARHGSRTSPSPSMYRSPPRPSTARS
jgi:Protein of unknown function (DUF664)